MDIPLPESWSDAAAHVLPVIRRATEPAHAWLAEQQDSANRLVRRPFAPHLRELIVLDLPELRLFLNHGHLADWGVSAKTAFTAAHANLAPAATSGLKRQDEWGLWQLDAGDGYESSRLVLSGWLSAFGPNAVAAIPAQRVLLVGDSSDPEATALLQTLAERAFRQGGGPLSPVLYTAGPEGRLVPWIAPEDHPAAPTARFAERLLAAWEYGAQADTLAEHADEPLAPIALHRSGPDSHTVSEVAALPALVPAVDQVLLDGTAVPFHELERAGRLAPTDLDPPRWRLT